MYFSHLIFFFIFRFFFSPFFLIFFISYGPPIDWYLAKDLCTLVNSLYKRKYVFFLSLIQSVLAFSLAANRFSTSFVRLFQNLRREAAFVGPAHCPSSFSFYGCDWYWLRISDIPHICPTWGRYWRSTKWLHAAPDCVRSTVSASVKFLFFPIVIVILLTYVVSTWGVGNGKSSSPQFVRFLFFALLFLYDITHTLCTFSISCS